MYRFRLNRLQGASGTSKNQWHWYIVSYVQYTSSVNFLKYRMLPEDGLI